MKIQTDSIEIFRKHFLNKAPGWGQWCEFTAIVTAWSGSHWFQLYLLKSNQQTKILIIWEKVKIGHAHIRIKNRRKRSRFRRSHCVTSSTVWETRDCEELYTKTADQPPTLKSVKIKTWTYVNFSTQMSPFRLSSGFVSLSENKAF